MTDNYTIQGNGLLVITEEQSAETTLKKVFIQSQNINVFPCSRRGQFSIETVDAEGRPTTIKANGDPEARLNTERTNRLRTSINGFTDSFIVNDSFTSGSTLIFTLAGYRIEVKEFDLAAIVTALGINDGIIYAHLSLHDGIPFGVANYFTELLYRQSNNAVNNYIDVAYTNDSGKSVDFFMGVSFTSSEAVDTIVVNDDTKPLKAANLPLFSKVEENWKLIEASKLPKVEHDTEPDSIKLSGDFTVEHTNNGEKQTSFKVTKDETVLGPTVMTSLIVGEKADDDEFQNGTIKAKTINVTGKATLNNGLEVTGGETALQEVTATEVRADTIIQNGNPVPAIALAQIDATLEVWQLQITTDASSRK